MAKIALAEMIGELRNEIQTAMEEGQQRSIRFEVEEVTLETEVEVTKGIEGGAGVKFWVFTSAEAKASAGLTHTQRIVLKLTPVGSDGGVVKVRR